MEPERISELVEILENWPANGKPQGDVALINRLCLLGYVAERQTTTPCKTCGTPRVDHVFLKVNNAGRHFVAAYRATPPTKKER